MDYLLATAPIVGIAPILALDPILAVCVCVASRFLLTNSSRSPGPSALLWALVQAAQSSVREYSVV